MTWVSHKKKEDIFCTVYFVIRKFFNIYVFTFSMYSVLNTPSEYTYLYTSKTLLHILLWLFLKSSKAFSVSLNRFSSLCFLNQKCYIVFILISGFETVAFLNVMLSFLTKSPLEGSKFSLRCLDDHYDFQM